MRNVFISFLGTGNYSECEYYYQDVSTKTEFIQQALLELFCKNFTKEDKIFIFLTEDAKEKNWENGLKGKIQSLELSAEIITVDIPVGKSEDEIWEIFNTMYGVLCDNDSVVLDITHGFRSLPMLGFVILQYAHYMKNVTVKDIFYGAFEAKDPNTDRTPIFQLTQFNNLMQWSSAADTFVNYGISDKLQNIVEETARFFRGTKGTVSAITKVTESMATLRGQDIIKGKIFRDCINRIDELEITGTSQTAFKPILSKVKEKLEVFKRNDPENFLYAVMWYIDHKMIPQALTMMQEGLLTYFMEKKEIDYQNRENRVLAGRYFNYISSWSKKYNNIKPTEEEKQKYQLWGWNLENSPFVKVADMYREISDLRNDVNHGGFNSDPTPYNKIIQNVNILFDRVKKICQELIDS